MLIPTNSGKLIHLDLVGEATEIQDGEASQITLMDGATHEMNFDLNMLEVMSRQIIPAEPGFFKLTLKYDDPHNFRRDPIIAWRICTPFAPEPITPFQDQLGLEGAAEGIVYPDGTVIMADEMHFADIRAWTKHVMTEREILMKAEAASKKKGK